MSARRKVEMVYEMIDRASRPARRLMRLQSRMARASERGNDRAARATQKAESATGRYARAQQRLQRQIQRSNTQLHRQGQKLRTNAKMMAGGIGGMGRAAVLAGGVAAAGAGAGAGIAAGFLAPARQFEKFETILQTTEGSAEKAKQAMGWVENFAVSTPYELEQVTDAFVKLRAYGLDPTNGLLTSLGDTSAAMGKDVIQAVEAMADAVTGENERLKEFGVKAAKVGKFFEYTYTMDGQSKTVRALAEDRAAIEQTLTGIFNEKYAGSMERLSLTFDGMLSNVMDQWTKFQRMVMDAGAYDWGKEKLRALLDLLDQAAQNGDLQAWAENVSGYVMGSLEAIWSFGAGAVGLWQDIYPWLDAAAGALGGWNRLAMVLLAIPMRGALFGAAAGMITFGRGALGAGLALGRLSFAGVAGGAWRLGLGLLRLLNPLKWVRAGFFALRAAVIASGVGAIALGLAAAGGWIYNNWSGLTEMFGGFGEGLRAALGPAGPLVDTVIGYVSDLIGWVGNLIGPIDASAETWRAWGVAAGAAVGDAINFVTGLPSRALDALSSGWAGVTAWTGRMWDGLTEGASAAWGALQNVLLNYTPQGLIYQHWDGISAWVAGLWDGLVSGAQSAWGALQAALAVYSPGAMIDQGWNTLASWAAGLWDGLVSGAETAWGALQAVLAVYSPGAVIDQGWNTMSSWAAGLWDGLISNAAAAWEGLKFLVGNYTAAGLIFSNWDGMVAFFENLWAQVKQIFADAWAFIESTVIAPMRSAVTFMTDNKLTRGYGAARDGITGWFSGDDDPVQKRAGGGSFGPGWLLTGEAGPELEYRSRGGFIAHHGALQKMVAMSDTVRRNSARARPLAMMRGAAVGASLATSAAAAHPAVLAQAGLGASGGDIDASLHLTVTGNVDADVMPKLEQMIKDAQSQILQKISRERHNQKRRGHQ